MDENFVNIYIDTVNKRLEEFIKNESILNAKIKLAEDIIKSLDESVKKINEEKNEKDTVINDLVKQNDALSQAASDLTNDYDAYKIKYNAQYDSAINHATSLNSRVVELENACNELLSKIKEKEDNISILEETHKKEKENYEQKVSYLEETCNELKTNANTNRKHIKTLKN